MPIYLRRLRSGAVNPKPQIEVVRGSLGLEVVVDRLEPGGIVVDEQ